MAKTDNEEKDQIYKPVTSEEAREGYRFGRPPKYTPELIEQCWNYLLGDINEKDEKKAQPEWIKLGHPFPSIPSLCLYIGIVSSTAHKWAGEDDKKDFSDILKVVKEFQHMQLLNNGVMGLYNPAVTKMILTKHGYSDKVENTNTVTTKTVYIDKEEKEDIDDHISSVVDG